MHNLVPLAFFAMIAAIVILPQYLRYKDRARLHETLRQAMDKGQPLPPELVGALATSRAGAVDPVEPFAYPVADRAQRDLRRGVIWLAVGVGIVLIGAAFYAGLYDVGGAPQTFASFAGIGAIPACIGLAFVGLWWFGRKDAV